MTRQQGTPGQDRKGHGDGTAMDTWTGQEGTQRRDSNRHLGRAGRGHLDRTGRGHLDRTGRGHLGRAGRGHVDMTVKNTVRDSKGHLDRTGKGHGAGTPRDGRAGRYGTRCRDNRGQDSTEHGAGTVGGRTVRNTVPGQHGAGQYGTRCRDIDNKGHLGRRVRKPVPGQGTLGQDCKEHVKIGPARDGGAGQ